MPGELPVFGMSATTVVEKAPQPEDEVPAFDFHLSGCGEPQRNAKAIFLFSLANKTRVGQS